MADVQTESYNALPFVYTNDDYSVRTKKLRDDDDDVDDDINFQPHAQLNEKEKNYLNYA